MRGTLAVLCAFLAGVSCESCDPGWTEYKGSCYQRGDTKLTWHHAELECMSHGGHLVTSSESAPELVQQLMKGYDTKVWVMPRSDDIILHSSEQCMVIPTQMEFLDYDFYDTIGSLIASPEDADNVNTFFFDTDFEEGARVRCEAHCDGEPACAAYTYFLNDRDFAHWWGTCIGRSDIVNYLVPYAYGMSGVKLDINPVAASCSEEHMYICEMPASAQ